MPKKSGKEADIMTMAVGHIVHAIRRRRSMREGRADLTALAREINVQSPTGRWTRHRSSAPIPTSTWCQPPYSYWLGKRGQVCLRGQAIDMGGLDSKIAAATEALSAIDFHSRNEIKGDSAWIWKTTRPGFSFVR